MVSIFSGIERKNVKKLLKELESYNMNFEKDVSILKSISKSNLLGILASGSAQIIRTDYDGNETIIEELYVGSVFGVRFSLLNNDEYDILTKEKSKIIFIDFDYIYKIDQKRSIYFQKFLINLLNITTSMVRSKNERINILTRKTTREKLLEYFENESKKAFSKVFYLPFNLTELAEYLSIDRSAMMREIRRLKDDRIIESIGNKITMLN
ncbi:MAG: Crp/Fnr family transcriptional regulator [Bacilli bacterium]|nr:Crp/Fnr family transcriptional regulator [Bacilli bacterium]